jgi:hypothetical protein
MLNALVALVDQLDDSTSVFNTNPAVKRCEYTFFLLRQRNRIEQYRLLLRIGVRILYFSLVYPGGILIFLFQENILIYIPRYVAAQFGSNFGLQQVLLGDFFKHAFDGDGDDGGSCIDGRLTSTWNWCSRVVKKPYYHAFILAGFQGFDGNWKE